MKQAAKLFGVVAVAVSISFLVLPALADNAHGSGMGRVGSGGAGRNFHGGGFGGGFHGGFGGGFRGRNWGLGWLVSLGFHLRLRTFALLLLRWLLLRSAGRVLSARCGVQLAASGCLHFTIAGTSRGESTATGC